MKTFNTILAVMLCLFLLATVSDLHAKERSKFLQTVYMLIDKQKKDESIDDEIKRIEENENLEEIAAVAFLLAYINNDTENNYKLALELLAKAHKDNPNHLDIAFVMNNLAELYYNQGKYAEAEPLYKESLKIRKIAYKDRPNHPDIATALNNLASLYDDQGKYTEAEPLYLESLKIRKIAYKDNPNHPDIATALNNLAFLYDNQGNYAEAEPLYKEALKIRKIAYKDNPNHPDIATALNNLASLYDTQGKYAEAESLYKEALKIDKNVYSDNPNHPDIAIDLNNLASLYDNQGNYAEAEPLYKEALKIWKITYKDNPNHPDIALALNNLALLYDNQGNYAEAEPLYKEALEIRKITYKDNPNHPDIAQSLNNLASLYDAQDNYAKAEPLYKEALKIDKNVYCDNPNHPDIAISLNNLAFLYYKQGKYVEAEPLYKEALNIRKIAYKDNPNHPDIATALNNLASLYNNQGNYAEAEPLYKEALKIRKIAYKDNLNHPDIAISLNNLASLYDNQGNYAEGEPLYQEALKIRKIAYKDNPNHPDIALALNNLAFLYDNQGNYAKAEPLYKEALKINKIAYKDNPNHPMIATSLNNLASLYNAQDNYAEAGPLYKEALKIWKIVYKENPNHQNIATSLNNLASLYNDQDNYTEAEPLYKEAIQIFENHPSLPDLGKKLYSNRSNLYYKTDRAKLAFDDLKKAIELALQMRKNASGDDKDRAEFFAQSYGLFVRMVRYQYEKLHNPLEAYLAMEQSRALGLQDLLDSLNIDYLAGVDKELADKLRKEDVDARAVFKELEDRIKKIQDNPNASEADKETHKKLLAEIPDAKKRCDDALTAIKAASPAYRLVIDKGHDPVSFDTIQQSLDNTDTLALEYIIGTKDSYLLVYGKNWKSPKIYPLVISEENARLLDQKKGALTQKINDSIITDPQTGLLKMVEDDDADIIPNEMIQNRLYAFWSVLMPDDEVKNAVLNAKKVLILSDGALTKFPFEMLIVEKPKKGTDPKYLLDCQPSTVYSPSATMWYRLLSRKSNENKSVLSMANPLYNKDLTATTTRGVTNILRYFDINKLSPLPFTQAESNAIVERSKMKGLKPVQNLGEKATEGAFRNAVLDHRYSVIHLACHGISENAFKTAFCALALAPGNNATENTEDDGFLMLEEMFKLNLQKCNLAILSACQTNLGEHQQGEGSWSICRGALTAGAKRVVTTNWSVDDIASAILVAQFTNDIMSQTSDEQYANCLQDARRLVRSGKINPKWKHPFYWAPFIMMGP